jgi:hypothetical protein
MPRATGWAPGGTGMKEHRGGEKPWSEDDLFDLDSALDWGGTAEDIADFLGREVAEVQRKAAERSLPDLSTYGIVPTLPVNPVDGVRLDFEKPAPSVRRDIGANDAPRVGGRKSGQ